jgi:hypothetical protein
LVRATSAGLSPGISPAWGTTWSFTESRWVEQQLGHPMIKVFNNIYAEHLAKRGKPPGAPGRCRSSLLIPSRGAPRSGAHGPNALID